MATSHEEYNKHAGKRKYYTVRCFIVISMVAIAVILVSLMVYDMAIQYNTSPPKEREVLKHLVMLRTTTTTEISKFTSTSEYSFLFPTTEASILNNGTIFSDQTKFRTYLGTNNISLSEFNNSIQSNNSFIDVEHSLIALPRYLTRKTFHAPDGTHETSFTSTQRSLPLKNALGILNQGEQSLQLSKIKHNIYDWEERKAPKIHLNVPTYEPYAFEKPGSLHKNNRNQSLGYTHRKTVESKNNMTTHWPTSNMPLNDDQESRILNNIHHQQPRPFRTGSNSTKRPINFYKHSRKIIAPYFGFEPYTKIYPQLPINSYRASNDVKNIQDIIKYMTESGLNRDIPKFGHQQVLDFEGPQDRKRGIKFSGLYKSPEPYIEEVVYNNGYDSIAELMVSNKANNMEFPSLLNGHAYIADPFHAYKPTDPSEVNLLANNNFRFSPTEEISHPNNQPNRWPTSGKINSNGMYFPHPPINFGKQTKNPSSPNVNQQLAIPSYPGLYTTAIYRPFGKDPTTSVNSPPIENHNSKKKTRPFSVMLDIYPMTENVILQGTKSEINIHPFRPLIRNSAGFRLTKPLKQKHNQFLSGYIDQTTQDPLEDENKHEMIVHLNLYPKKRHPLQASSRNDNLQSFYVDVNSASFEDYGELINFGMGKVDGDDEESSEYSSLENKTIDESKSTNIGQPLKLRKPFNEDINIEPREVSLKQVLEHQPSSINSRSKGLLDYSMNVDQTYFNSKQPIPNDIIMSDSSEHFSKTGNTSSDSLENNTTDNFSMLELLNQFKTNNIFNRSSYENLSLGRNLDNLSNGGYSPYLSSFNTDTQRMMESIPHQYPLNNMSEINHIYQNGNGEKSTIMSGKLVSLNLTLDFSNSTMSGD